MKYLLACWVLMMIGFPAWGAATDQDLEQANTTFRYQDNPIHPGLVNAFHNWEADYRPPIVTMVDVGAAYNTNEFHKCDGLRHTRSGIVLERMQDVCALRHTP